MTSHYFCWECGHRSTGTTKVKKGSKEAVYVICMHLVCLCTSVKETPVNSSPCFIAKRHQDHHMLVSWWYIRQASLPCLYLPLSSSLIFTSCTTMCVSTELPPAIWIQFRCHFALASLSACACAQFMHINICHILTKLKFLKHYRHIYVCMHVIPALYDCLPHVKGLGK